jgi:hypothetical protein
MRQIYIQILERDPEIHRQNIYVGVYNVCTGDIETLTVF